jgi:hypothetical protein
MKIRSCRPLSPDEAAGLLDMTKGEREQPLIVRFYCDKCKKTFRTIWLFPDTPMSYDYRGHDHTLSPEDLAKFRSSTLCEK